MSQKGYVTNITAMSIVLHPSRGSIFLLHILDIFRQFINCTLHRQSIIHFSRENSYIPYNVYRTIQKTIVQRAITIFQRYSCLSLSRWLSAIVTPLTEALLIVQIRPHLAKVL
jgi:hypothetical protein